MAVKVDKKLVVRSATRDDYEAVRTISKKIWSNKKLVEAGFPDWLSEDFVPHEFFEWLDNPDSHPFVICDNETGDVYGVVNLKLIDQGKTGWLGGIRIDPHIHGRGIGRKLTQEVIKWAQEHTEVNRLRLSIMETNVASIKLSTRVGFQKVNYTHMTFFPTDKIVGHAKTAKKIPITAENITDVTTIFEYLHKEWFQITKHPTIEIGGTFLEITKENIASLLRTWKFIALRDTQNNQSNNNSILGLYMWKTRKHPLLDHNKMFLRGIFYVPQKWMEIALNHILLEFNAINDQIEMLQLQGRFVDTPIVNKIFFRNTSAHLKIYTLLLFERPIKK